MSSLSSDTTRETGAENRSGECYYYYYYYYYYYAYYYWPFLSSHHLFQVYYKVRQHILLQKARMVCHYKARQLFYYKVRQFYCKVR